MPSLPLGEWAANGECSWGARQSVGDQGQASACLRRPHVVQQGRVSRAVQPGTGCLCQHLSLSHLVFLARCSSPAVVVPHGRPAAHRAHRGAYALVAPMAQEPPWRLCVPSGGLGICPLLQHLCHAWQHPGARAGPPATPTCCSHPQQWGHPAPGVQKRPGTAF